MFNFSLLDSINLNCSCYGENNPEYVFFPFLGENGEKLQGAPMCGITLKCGGSMRFRWNEENPNRNRLTGEIEQKLGFVAGLVEEKRNLEPRNGDFLQFGGNSRAFIPVQLDHTKIVYWAEKFGDTKGKVGDGILTLNRELVPSVTVADCVPIYLFDRRTGAFGIVHSGWKGTGIGAGAIELAGQKIGSRAEDFFVVIGPHIKGCCYIVNQQRADYFAREFTPDCVSELEPGVSVDWNNGGGKLYRLSLDVANVAMFKNAGVPDNHIAVCSDCTCCNDVFGSNRRETAAAGKPDVFTVMAAFVCY